MPARTATAATAAPVPAAAPKIHVGGEAVRNSAASPRMTTRPGTMNATPPTMAPSGPATRHAEKIASCVDAGPGNKLHAAIASSNSAVVSHRRCSTQRSRSSAMWAGGPPKPMQPIRPHWRATVSKDGRDGASYDRRHVVTRLPVSVQRPAGWNSSTTLPDGSSRRICFPPGPSTMSLRNVAPARAQPSNFGVDVVDDEVDAVPAPGSRLGAVGHRPAHGAPRSRRAAGAGCHA